MLATQTTTLHDLLDESRDQDTHKADYKGPAKSFRFDDASGIVPDVTGSIFGDAVSAPSLQPTEWAWSQVFTKLGPSVFGKNKNKSLPADYLLALRPEQRAGLLNDHLSKTDTSWLVRSYDTNARAVLSDKYTAINNTDLLDILTKVTDGSDLPSGITRTSSVTPDSLNVRIIFKNVETGDDSRGNGNWGIGVYVRNGETGNRRGGIFPLVQRHSCQNSIIVDNSVGSYEFLHLGSAAAKLVTVKATIADTLPFAAHLLDLLIQADEQAIPEFSDVLAGICKQYGWSEQTKLNVARGTEGRETRLGLINGVTYAAHSIPDPDLKADIETIGGSLLVAPDSVFYQAASVGRQIK